MAEVLAGTGLQLLPLVDQRRRRTAEENSLPTDILTCSRVAGRRERDPDPVSVSQSDTQRTIHLGGQKTQLPLNDPAKQNATKVSLRRAIACVGARCRRSSAWVAGNFKDQSTRRSGRKTVAGRLSDSVSDLPSRHRSAGDEVQKVIAPAPRGVAAGAGFHPYIRIPLVTGGDPADYRVQCAARSSGN